MAEIDFSDRAWKEFIELTNTQFDAWRNNVRAAVPTGTRHKEALEDLDQNNFMHYWFIMSSLVVADGPVDRIASYEFIPELSEHTGKRCVSALVSAELLQTVGRGRRETIEVTAEGKRALAATLLRWRHAFEGIQKRLPAPAKRTKATNRSR